jgi:hypothetical protein
VVDKLPSRLLRRNLLSWGLSLIVVLLVPFHFRAYRAQATLCTPVTLRNLVDGASAVCSWRFPLEIHPEVANVLPILKILLGIGLYLVSADLMFFLNRCVLMVLNIFQIDDLWRFLRFILVPNILLLLSIPVRILLRWLGYLFERTSILPFLRRLNMDKLWMQLLRRLLLLFWKKLINLPLLNLSIAGGIAHSF